MKILIGAGGTGGHIIPALAIAEEMKHRGWDVFFIGNRDSMEENVINKHNFPFFPIQVQKIYRSMTFLHLKFPYFFIQSLVKCIQFTRKIKPDAVFCTGGFVSAPVALGGIILRKKLYIQDGNSYPGLTTRCMALFAKYVFTAIDEAQKHFRTNNCILTGNPLMKYNRIDKTQVNWRNIKLREGSKKLFIIGGSQGSIIINKAIEQCLDQILDMDVEIIWQTGKTHYQFMNEKYANKLGTYCFDFTDRISDFYQMADFAISRAGALSIAELTEHKIPAIYIPLPASAGNHQYKNALTQTNKGCGILLEQRFMNPETLIETIRKLLGSYNYYIQNLLEQPPNNATLVIADIIEKEVITNWR